MGAMNNSKDIIAAFSEDQTGRLTGVSKSQLRYWDRTNFYSPTYAEDNRRLAFSRVFSFKDIVALRVLNVLRNQYCVSLHHLREVSNKLSHLQGGRWTEVKLFVVNKRVHWIEPGTKLPQEVLSKQYVVPTMVLMDVVKDTRHDVKQLNKRDESEIGEITKSRFVAHNKPVISGTRITIAAIKRFADAGYKTDQIVKEYPDLTAEDVAAALAYDPQRSAA